MLCVPGVDVAFETVPTLKYAEDVALHSPVGATNVNNSETVMLNFARMKSLRLRQFSWTFLRQESARELRLINVSADPLGPSLKVKRSVEELVRCCVAFPRDLGGEPLELDFTENGFYGRFGLRIIKLLKGTGRDVTFRMRTQDDDELTLDRAEYTVDFDGTTTGYASDESGIVVEVERGSVTIHATVVVPRKKPRTSDEVSDHPSH